MEFAKFLYYGSFGESTLVARNNAEKWLVVAIKPYERRCDLLELFTRFFSDESLVDHENLVYKDDPTLRG